MEGRGPYRIYDPGGSTPLGEEVSAAFDRLVEENTRLKGKIQGIKMLGELLEESQMEASRLRQKAEALVRDSELPPPPPAPSLVSFDPLAELTGTRTIQNPRLPWTHPAQAQAPNTAGPTHSHPDLFPAYIFWLQHP